jgi:glycosyltransferase involved in cell wall biosynthesis
MKGKTKVLWIGDGGVATGFARVNHSIIDNLPEDKYEAHHLAVNYRGDPYPNTKSLMYPAMIGGDIYGMTRLPGLIKKIKPDIIFILNDTWILPNYLHYIPEGQKVVTYFPVDAKPLEAEWCKAIAERTTPVAYTEFGREAMLEQTDVKTDIRVIPHGIDTKTFYPIDMLAARAELEGVPPDSFVVLNSNRNQPRKRIDLTIKGFAKFAKDKPQNVKLYLHMGRIDAGWDIISLCERYGILSRLLLTSLELGPNNYVSDERLNVIYNSADVGLNTSMGEGWGLCSMEMAVCRKAQILTECSANTELYGEGRGYLMPVDHYDTYPMILTDGAVVSEDTVAEALEYYYSNPQVREADAQAIYDYFTQPKFDWKNIAGLWDELFDEVLSK